MLLLFFVLSWDVQKQPPSKLACVRLCIQLTSININTSLDATRSANSAWTEKKLAVFAHRIWTFTILLVCSLKQEIRCCCMCVFFARSKAFEWSLFFIFYLFDAICTCFSVLFEFISLFCNVFFFLLQLLTTHFFPILYVSLLIQHTMWYGGEYVK